MSLKIPWDKNGRRTLMQQSGNFGEPHYMDPEIFYQSPTFDGVSADLWSVLLILYEMLTVNRLYNIPPRHDWHYRFFLCQCRLHHADVFCYCRQEICTRSRPADESSFWHTSISFKARALARGFASTFFCHALHSNPVDRRTLAPSHGMRLCPRRF
eukprot:scaffold8681_cov200-Amphora_coffeaeformis.AAC.11